MHPLPRLVVPLLVLGACTGPEDATDSDGWLGCELTTGFTTFDATAPAGGELSIPIRTEARCQDPITLDLSWRDPHSGAFVLSPELAANPQVVLQPYAPQDLVVLFQPTEPGAYQDRLEMISDNPLASGAILRFDGIAE